SGWLGRKGKRAEAEAAMAKVSDARAVPSIWKILGTAGPAYQELAALLLRQIDAPAASQVLASLSVVGASADVRGQAAYGLIGRAPRELARGLIGLLRDPIEYEVRAVGGPGKPGELYIRGQRANARFFYSAPPPLVTLRPTDVVGFDDYGLPVA